MKIENPKVTLADEARNGVKEEVRSGFLDWLMEFNVEGDDGELYALGGSILSLALEKIDLVNLCYAKGKGSVKQLRNSVYKLAKYPGTVMNNFYRNPQGTLQIEKRENSVLVTCTEHYKVECFDNGTWHLMLDTCDGEYKADLYHRAHGFPLWYGREKPSLLTQHSITYGYNWSGDVDGTIWLNGKEIKVKGTGQRERYVAVDSSAAELGGWEDWGYITFNEIHSSMYDMRLGMKDYSVYDLENEKHYTSNGNLKGGDRDTTEMEIIHEDWAFMRELDGFVPSYYNIRIKVEDGVYEARAHVCNARVWGVTFQTPDNPVASVDSEKRDSELLDFYASDDVATSIANKLDDSCYKQVVLSCDLPAIDGERDLKKHLYKFIMYQREMLDESVEQDPVYALFVRDLYCAHSGRNKDLRSLYDSVTRSIYSWDGLFGEQLICLDDSNDKYSIVENLSIKPHLIKTSPEDEVFRFLPTIAIRYRDAKDENDVTIFLDYALYRLIQSMKDGYRPSSQDCNIHADFVSKIKALIDLGEKGKKVFIIPKDSETKTRYIFEETEFGYSFKEVKL